MWWDMPRSSSFHQLRWVTSWAVREWRRMLSDGWRWWEEKPTTINKCLYPLHYLQYTENTYGRISSIATLSPAFKGLAEETLSTPRPLKSTSQLHFFWAHVTFHPKRRSRNALTYDQGVKVCSGEEEISQRTNPISAICKFYESTRTHIEIYNCGALPPRHKTPDTGDRWYLERTGPAPSPPRPLFSIWIFV